MFLFFQGFQPQNVLILLFSTKHSYVLTVKITSDVNNSFNWDTGYIKYFNKNLEEYKFIYPDETPITSQKMTLTVFRSFFCM